MATYPKDRFDEVPDELLRVGAHRAPAKKGRGWIAFGWAALATIVLVLAGLVALAALNDDFELGLPGFEASEPPLPEPEVVAPTAEPTIAPEIPITILNGTATVGLANTVGDSLVEQGWAGADLGTGSRANAAQNDVEETIVYYNAPELEGAARGIVQSLGMGDVRLSDDFPGSPLTIVIGLDYRPAG